MSEAKDKNNNESSGDKDTKKEGKNTLSLGGSKGTLSLKGNAGSRIRQSIPTPGTGTGTSSGVEVRRTSRISRRKTADTEQPAESKADDQLTASERTARAEALQRAQAAGEQKRTTLPKRRTTLETVKREARDKEAEERANAARDKQADSEEKEQTAVAADPNVDQPSAKANDAGRRRVSLDDSESDSLSYRDRLKKAEDSKKNTRSDSSRRSKRITVTQAMNNDYERDRGPSLAAQKRAREKARLAGQTQGEQKKVVREVIVPEVITVGELANRMAESTGDVVKKLMQMGVMATVTQSIDADTAELLIGEFGHSIKRVTDADVEIGLEGAEDTEKDLLHRAPVVTIMGHVDHGKTSLLDALRSTDVVAGEAGGITQHIGAYQVTMQSGDKITFLDTPGHEAFTEMRSRGANVTDIVVVVVAADDSIMPQTIEAISHAKAANVPIIIAINKIDLPTADPMKVKTQLLQYEVVVEELSGDVQCVEISAKQKMNLDKLEEAILIQAEMLELKANPNREASGIVVEAKMEKGRGSVATILIQNGTLKVGDIFVTGKEYGKIRAIVDDHGKNVESAIPGQPVEILGISGTPAAGDTFHVVNSESRAREIAAYRQRKERQAQAAMAVKGRTTIEQLLEQRGAGEKTKLPIIVKADVHGSIEAIAGSLAKMVQENDDIEVQTLHSGVGGITESDVKLAKASGGVIIGFNVRANAQARDMAQREGVDIRYYNVIYNVIDDAKAILTGMLSPVEREEYIGQAEILQVFKVSKVGNVAGCIVKIGMVKRGARVRLLRDDIVILDGGTLKTLQRFKDEVAEVKEGTECGMAFENYEDIKVGDVIECYTVTEEARTVS